MQAQSPEPVVLHALRRLLDDSGDGEGERKDTGPGPTKSDNASTGLSLAGRVSDSKSLRQKTRELEMEHICKSLLASGGNKTCAARLLRHVAPAFVV